MGFMRLPAPTEEDLYELPPVPQEQHFKAGNKISLPSLKWGAVILVQLALGILFILIGISAAGSAFGTPAEKFKGILATVFYSWQLGNLLMIGGTVLVYDVLRRKR